MFSLLWSISSALRGYLRFYMPTSRAVDWLRTTRGLKWAFPVALVAAPAYLFATSVCATLVERGGPAYLNVLVILYFWNAVKFTWLIVLTTTSRLNGTVRRCHGSETPSCQDSPRRSRSPLHWFCLSMRVARS